LLEGVEEREQRAKESRAGGVYHTIKETKSRESAGK